MAPLRATLFARQMSMEGTGRVMRFMRFADVADVEEAAVELAEVVRSWCRFVAGG